MNQTSPAADRGTLSHRSGSSRKLLARKAAAMPPVAQADAPEDAFPSAGQDTTPLAVELSPEAQSADDTAPGAAEQPHAERGAADPATARSAPHDAGGPERRQSPAPQASWSDEDERAFVAMAARRKAAGYQRRGRDVSGQLLRAGTIAPNTGTVVATVVALVAERGTVARADLLDAMAVAAFGNAKAKPQDRAWCQGYVQGAVRDGFLAIVTGTDVGETSPAATSPAVTL